MLPEADHYRLDYLLLADLRARLKECPVAILPTGVNEWHGEHNAIGLDALAATYVAERAMILLGGGVLFPTNWVGTYGFANYPGTVVFDQPTTKAVFQQYFQNMIRMGFRVGIILTGHWGPFQTNALKSAAQAAEEWARGQGVETRMMGWRLVDIGPPYVGGHAKQTETSLLMQIGTVMDRRLVDMTRFRQGDQDMVGEMYTMIDDDEALRGDKIWNWEEDLTDQSICSAAIGEEYATKTASGIVLEILELLAELDIHYEPANGIPDFPL